MRSRVAQNQKTPIVTKPRAPMPKPARVWLLGTSQTPLTQNGWVWWFTWGLTLHQFQKKWLLSRTCKMAVRTMEPKYFWKLDFLFLSWFYKKFFDLFIPAFCFIYEENTLETFLPHCIVLHLLRYASRKVLCTQNSWFMLFEFFQQPSVNWPWSFT